MSDDKPGSDGPPVGSTAMWTWIVMLMVLFMGLVVVMALIEANAQ